MRDDAELLAPSRAVFYKDLSAPDPVPETAIETPVALLRDGRLFRYGEDRGGAAPVHGEG